MTFTSSAQAASGAAIKPVPTTAMTPTATELRNNCRRVMGRFESRFRTASSLAQLIDLLVTPAPFDHFDLIAVRVLDEKKPGQGRALVLEIDDVARRQPGRAKTHVRGR